MCCPSPLSRALTSYTPLVTALAGSFYRVFKTDSCILFVQVFFFMVKDSFKLIVPVCIFVSSTAAIHMHRCKYFF